MVGLEKKKEEKCLKITNPWWKEYGSRAENVYK